MNHLNPEVLKEIVQQKMPFGKYKGTTIANIPVHYLEWFARKGFPEGKLGMMLQTVLVIKQNGLEDILNKLMQDYG